MTEENDDVTEENDDVTREHDDTLGSEARQRRAATFRCKRMMM